MSWILIFLVMKSEALTSGSVNFAQRAECEAAKAAIEKEFTGLLTKVRAVCVKA